MGVVWAAVNEATDRAVAHFVARSAQSFCVARFAPRLVVLPGEKLGASLKYNKPPPTRFTTPSALKVCSSLMRRNAAGSEPRSSPEGRGFRHKIKRFVIQGYEDFDRTANFVPSSRFLVSAMVRAAEVTNARAVLELGPGTGAITSALLSAMPSDAVLCTLECDSLMNDVLVSHVVDPRLRAVVGDAQDADKIIAELGLSGEVGAVVSSIGLSLLTTEARERIMSAVGSVLAPGGVYVQYVYCHARVAVYSPTRGWSRFNARRYLEGRFAKVSRRLVPMNVPPAWVYRCEGPRA